MGSIPITRFHSGWTAGPRGNVECKSSRLRRDRDRGVRSERGEHERRGPGQIVGDMTDNTAAVAQLVERVLGKDEVLGSNPSGSSGICGPDREVGREP